MYCRNVLNVPYFAQTKKSITFLSICQPVIKTWYLLNLCATFKLSKSDISQLGNDGRNVGVMDSTASQTLMSSNLQSIFNQSWRILQQINKYILITQHAILLNKSLDDPEILATVPAIAKASMYTSGYEGCHLLWCSSLCKESFVYFSRGA